MPTRGVCKNVKQQQESRMHSLWSPVGGVFECFVFALQSCHDRINELFHDKIYLIGIAALVVAVIMVRTWTSHSAAARKCAEGWGAASIVSAYFMHTVCVRVTERIRPYTVILSHVEAPPTCSLNLPCEGQPIRRMTEKGRSWKKKLILDELSSV